LEQNFDNALIFLLKCNFYNTLLIILLYLAH